MAELKKTTKYDMKLKGLCFEGDELVNEDGEIIDIIACLKAAYRGKFFDMSLTAKEEELLDVDIDNTDYNYEEE